MNEHGESVLAPPGIFKAYDIRGLYGSEMDATTAHAIGRAFARVLARLRGKPASELRIGLGRDMRLTAPEMAAELRDGLIFEGATVLDAGMVATEMLYHLVGSRELDGGAMVTASHNPKAYTGVKLVREGALPLSGDAGIGEVQAEIEAGFGQAPGGGSLEEVDVWEEYRAHAASFIDPARVKPMKVVVDGGNGMAGPMVGPILETLPLELEEMYFEPNGEFPDHEPNPLLEENRRMIIDRVRASGADLGIAWDGDADRCFFIDGEGSSATATSSAPSSPARSCARTRRGRRSSTTRARAARCRTWSPPRAAAPTSRGSAMPSSRRGCARRAPPSVARSPATTTSATSGMPTRGRSRRC